ncbi:hypothetical protein FSP39_013502 [Pinctada imbricata]|uniref:HSac2 domain-containing protein n=1 Tax=Pinctada imbricata TaxID=66713 RepID=A0AA88YGA0_PINIB|nr:hypothetical protein FSP39_013502 [Pinctada imbricata]
MANTNGENVISTQDVHLEDDRQHQGSFSGATLQIDGVDNQNGDEPGVGFRGSGQNFNRNRPGSTMSRQSVRSTSSRTSMRPGVVKSDSMTSSYFSYKEDSLQLAVEEGKKMMNPDVDGEVKGTWLLTEIDHWNNEKERVVILTDTSLITLKYHFILKRVVEFRRVMLHVIDTVAVGDFRYPDKSLMPDRRHGGIQIRWNKGEEPTWAQKWNPFCLTIPFMTFCHHPIIYNPKETETTTYNVDDFFESLIQCISNIYKKKRPGEKVTIIEGPIMIESYANLSSMLFNDSGLGFFRDRNGLCY